MISLYELFKIIFGMVIAGFVLVIVVQVVGVYTGVQEDSYDAGVLRNGIKTAGDVYVTGNAVEAPFPEIRFSASPPSVNGVAGQTPLTFPLFISPPIMDTECVGTCEYKLLLWKQTLDLGWTSFSFVEAVPPIKVYFNLQDAAGWEFIRNVVTFLPDSAFLNTKVTFGTCDGSLLSSGLEQQDFLALPSPGVMRVCTAPLPENGVLLTVDSSCIGVTGICATTPVEGVGDVHASGKQFWYSDPLDVAVLLIGGEKKDITGPRGVALLQYKTAIFRNHTMLAARLEANRALLVGKQYPPGSSCYTGIGTFAGSMNAIISVLSSPLDTRDATLALSRALTRARLDYESLIVQGCDL